MVERSHFQAIWRLAKGHSTAEAGGVQKKLADAVAEETARHAGTPVELWATDEHRLRLKPVQRRVWAPVGVRPLALGHHRFEWLYLTAFVAPASVETCISPTASTSGCSSGCWRPSRETGAGRDRIVVLVLDGAGWHSEPGLAVPEGIRLVYLPPYTPELPPAEHLWPLVDEPVANRHFETLDELDAVLAERCRTLAQNRVLIAANTTFHWWPKPNAAN